MISRYEQQPRFCVIGSGPGGAFAAVALAEAGHNVLVLEGGNEALEAEQSSFIDKLDVTGGARPDFGFSRQMGGSSNLWAGRVAQIEPIDFALRDWVPHSGWPFSRRDLEPFYRIAMNLMGLPSPPTVRRFAASAPPSWQALEKSVDLKEFYWNIPPFNTGAYLRRAEARLGGRLQICLGAIVRSLILSGDRSTVLAADTIIDGEEHRLPANTFVIGAGGLETPRLLLASDEKGIGNEYGNVGRYLSTHPKADIGLLLLSKAISPRLPIFSDQQELATKVRIGLGLHAETQKTLCTLNHYVQLSPLFEHHANKAFELIKGSKAVKAPLLNRNAAIGGLLPGIGQLAFATIGKLARVQPKARKFVLRGFLDQFPSPEHRVYLSDQVDRMGRPKLNVDWTFTDADRNSVLIFLEYLDAAFKHSGLGRLDFEPLRSSYEWPIIGIHSHFMGTTRMGNDPRHSVVDANGKIHGTKNCYISGPSTFPTYGYANPFLTIAALSLRLAEHMQQRSSLTAVRST